MRRKQFSFIGVLLHPPSKFLVNACFACFACFGLVKNDRQVAKREEGRPQPVTDSDDGHRRKESHKDGNHQIECFLLLSQFLLFV